MTDDPDKLSVRNFQTDLISAFLKRIALTVNVAYFFNFIDIMLLLTPPYLVHIPADQHRLFSVRVPEESPVAHPDGIFQSIHLSKNLERCPLHNDFSIIHHDYFICIDNFFHIMRDQNGSYFFYLI